MNSLCFVAVSPTRPEGADFITKEIQSSYIIIQNRTSSQKTSEKTAAAASSKKAAAAAAALLLAATASEAEQTTSALATSQQASHEAVFTEQAPGHTTYREMVGQPQVSNRTMLALGYGREETQACTRLDL